MKETKSITENKKRPPSVMIFGCGYVGSALAFECLAQGMQVGALTRNPETAERLCQLGVGEVIVGNLQDFAWHAKVREKYDTIVNCVSSAGGGLSGYRLSYLEGQRSILAWANDQKIRTYLYTSSTSVYPQDGGVLVTESAATNAAPETAQVILESEQLITQAAASFSNWYVFRLAGIYGPGRHYLLDQLRNGLGVIPGRGDYTLNLIHLDDIVAAILAALNSEGAASGIYNITDDCPETKSALLEWLAKQLELAPPQFDPENISPRLERRGGRMPDRKISNAKAKAQLAWSPKYASFREGYAALLQAGS